jgi:DNA-binding CsgD family transcriptional regulator
MASSLTVLARRAAAATTLDEMRGEVLDTLRPIVGFDCGIVWRPADPEARIDGFDRRIWERYHEREAAYAEDIGAIAGAACTLDGVTRDAVALTGAQRRRSAFMAEIIRPAGSASFLTAVMRLRGQVVAMMQLGRAPGFDFTEKAAQSLRELLPIITLAEAAHPSPLFSRPLGLTRRERELLGYLVKGFTNREIALACGTSRHTVRNQLAGLFRKADVSTRSELVAWALGALG